MSPPAVIKLIEKYNGNSHALMVTGPHGGGKTFLLDQIQQTCPDWGFVIASRGELVSEILMLTAARRAPRSIVPLVAAAADAWGFDVVKPKSGNEAAHVLQLQRRAA